MSANSSAARPVEVLASHVAELNRALDACREDAAERNVHRLRTMTRRLEGQLALLESMPSPPHRKRLKRLRRRLKKVRREAATVRDLDVLLEHATRLRVAHAREEWRQHRQSVLAELKRERDRAAVALHDGLERHGGKLQALLADLLCQFEEHGHHLLQQEELAQIANLWFAQQTARARLDPDEDERLHSIRKAAKLARYMGENAPGKIGPAVQLAMKMQGLQKAGGEWHDCLTLEQAVAQRLGKRSAVAKALKLRCQRLRERYGRMLERFSV